MKISMTRQEKGDLLIQVTSWAGLTVYTGYNTSKTFAHNTKFIGAVIVWWLDLKLPMQSVPITTDVVSSNLDQGEVYNIM